MTYSSDPVAFLESPHAARSLQGNVLHPHAPHKYREVDRSVLVQVDNHLPFK